MNRTSRLLASALAVLWALGVVLPTSSGAFQWVPYASDAENDAIRYSTGTPSEAIARLQQQIDAGTTELQFDAKNGYLKSVLQQLDIPVASQALVFSKTSFQREFISPSTPRALYFNHDVHVGWVQGGRVLEIASMDPKLGAVFYTLRQERAAHPLFQRQTGACLQCHDSPSLTGGVPGLIVRSVYPDKEGWPMLSAGTYVTSDQSAFEERWGGWWVTGTHDAQTHMGASVTDLSTRIDTAPYLSEQSDIVALMVLGHQSSIHNLITYASYRTRMALHFDEMRNHELGRGSDYIPDTTASLIRTVAEPLVRAMLFVDEAPLTTPVSGRSGFSTEFPSQGPRDTRGRSLQELDLTHRLFRYPCSYLVYSASFDALPTPAKDYVYRRLWEVLGGKDDSDAFAHLSRADRAAIMEILLDTKPDFAAWRTRVE